jgi:hypothetical protein
MNSSFLGKPVFNFDHKVVDINDAFNFTAEEKEKHAVGVISGVGYDVESGMYFVDMMVWDEETQKNIDDGYGVSNAYIPQVIGGGEYNNVSYDREVVDGKYDHMAIVDNPRYGDVRIFENSKKGEKVKKYILFGKEKEDVKQNAKPPADKKDEGVKLNMNSVIVVEGGEEIPISEMVELYKNSEDKKNSDKEKPTMNMDDTVEIDGKEVSMKELVDNYNSKKNAEPDEDPKENEDEEDKEDVKKNSNGGGKEGPNKKFFELKTNANKGAEPEKIKINTQKSRIDLGKARYGSAVQVEGGK